MKTKTLWPSIFLAAPFAWVACFDTGMQERCAHETCGCFNNDDCASEQVCYLLLCRSRGAVTYEVLADITPPNTADILPQSDPLGPRTIPQGRSFDIVLRPAVRVVGSIQSDTPTGGKIAARRHWPSAEIAAALPSALLELETPVSLPGNLFALALLPDVYTWTFSPAHAAGHPSAINSAALPPISYAQLSLTAPTQGGVELTLSYPATTELVRLKGRLVAQASALQPATPVEGARVQAVAPTSHNTYASADGETASDGTFQLILPAPAGPCTITVRRGTNPLVPETTFLDITPMPTQPEQLPDLVLAMTFQTTPLHLLVRDLTDHAVPAAMVYVTGTVGTASAPGRFSLTASTDPDGAVTTQLLPGHYDLTIVPAPKAPQARSHFTLCVPQATHAPPLEEPTCDGVAVGAQPMVVRLEDKINVTGRVSTAAGEPCDQARLVWRQHNSQPQRELVAYTDAQGVYSIGLDPGAQQPALYEVTIEPESTSGLPRLHVRVAVGTEALRSDFQLSETAWVFGRVLNPNGSPLAGATVALYSVQPAANATQPLLLGLGSSTPDGEFVIALPAHPSR